MKFESHKYEKQYLENVKLISRAFLFSMEQPQSFGLSVLSYLSRCTVIFFFFFLNTSKELAKDLNIMSYFIFLNLSKQPCQRNANPDTAASTSPMWSIWIYVYVVGERRCAFLYTATWVQKHGWGCQHYIIGHFILAIEQFKSRTGNLEQLLNSVYLL